MAAEPRYRPLTLEDYLELPEHTDREREIIRGRLVVAPRPFRLHQDLLGFLYHLLLTYLSRRGGHRAQLVLDADLLFDAVNTYVSPDLMYFAADAVPLLLELDRAQRRLHLSVVRPELVVEVLSPGSEARDLVEKRRDYAAAGIPHYWVLDYRQRVFHELVLAPERCEYDELIHSRGRVRPRLFAGERPPLSLDLARLWPDRSG